MKRADLGLLLGRHYFPRIKYATELFIVAEAVNIKDIESHSTSITNYISKTKKYIKIVDVNFSICIIQNYPVDAVCIFFIILS